MISKPEQYARAREAASPNIPHHSSTFRACTRESVQTLLRFCKGSNQEVQDEQFNCFRQHSENDIHSKDA